ncbi:MAG: pilus (MSHA type) biogenesis protein MshL [Magnetococcales bacterium]|nr:pilus (MSHA type) biogenesis protein MshL [Magnetococcales bacterium]
MSIRNSCKTIKISDEETTPWFKRPWFGLVMGCLLLAACQNSNIKSSKSHFLRPTNPPIYMNSESDDEGMEDFSQSAANSQAKEEEVYTITVTEMSVRDLLFALARDADKNIDVYPGIEGRVTLSAIDQTLPQILDRISNQVTIRYEINEGTIIVSPDLPYLKIYEVDYINIMRSSKSTNKVSTRLSSADSDPNANLSLTNGSNLSTSNLDTSTTNQFWKTLAGNIETILNPRESQEATSPSAAKAVTDGDDLLVSDPDGLNLDALPKEPPVEASLKGPGILALNPEAGHISIYASSRQHDRITRLLDSIMGSVHRQVMIESTVVEVELNDQFQEGVDWDIMLNSAADIGIKGIFSKGGFFSLGRDPSPDTFNSNNSSVTSKRAIRAAIKVLETFGNTKVLSSPKIMALNNQPALLKVVKNKVFFTLKSNPNTTTSVTDGTTASSPVFDTKIHTVPVGLIMNVTPQISKDGIVTMNVRPTITRITSTVNDPNPALQANNTTNGIEKDIISQIPEIEVKEMETIMRIHSGQVAVMGGLMQDEIVNESKGVPGLGRIPGLGILFSHKDRIVKKTELVIFLRPVIIGYDSPRNKKQLASRNRGHLSTDTRGNQTASRTVRQPQEDVAPISNPGRDAMPTISRTAPTPGGGSYLDFTNPQQGMNNGAVQHAPSPGPAMSQPQANPASFGGIAPAPMQPAVMPAQLPQQQPRFQPAPYPTQQSFQYPGATPAYGQAPPQQGGFFVDLGSYLQQGHANDVTRQVSAIGLPAHQESALVQGQTYQRVRSGPFPSQEMATQAMAKITNYTGIQARISRF